MPAESVTGLDSIEEFLDADGQCKGAAFLEAPLVGSGPCVPPAVEKSPVEDSCGGGSGLVLNALDSGSGALNETWGQGGAWSDENKHRASASGSIANTNGGVFGALLSTAVENGVNPAQGASAKRPFCKQCQKPEVVCICATMPKAKVPNKTKLLVLQHYKERKHPLGSVRFAKLGFENVEVVVVKELGSGLPWLKPPFSRKERARARALARAQEREASHTDTPPGPSENPSGKDEGDSAGGGSLGPSSAAIDRSVSQTSTDTPVPAPASTETSINSKAPEGKHVGSTLGEALMGETVNQVASNPLGEKSLPAVSDEANGSTAPAAQPEPQVQEVRWERDKSGRKVRYPTFAPPPGIELTPGTAVLFPGPTSVDLLEAAQFWGLAVHSSPFSPAVSSGGIKVPATAGCNAQDSSSSGSGSSNEPGGMSSVVDKQLWAAIAASKVGVSAGVVEKVTEQLGAASLGSSEDSLSSVGRASSAAANPLTPAEESGAAKPLEAGSLERPPRNPVAFPAAPPDQLILIDGTWSKATRVYHEHGWLHNLPQYRLPLGKRTSRYRNLRKEPKKEYLSTLESGAWALQLIEPALVDDIEGVLDSFGEMIKRQAEYQAEAVRQGRCWKLAQP